MTNDPAGNPETHRSLRSIASRFSAGYKACALMFFNLIVAFLLLNLVLGAVIGFRSLLQSGQISGPDVVTVRYGPDTLEKVYPCMERQEREQMLSEVWKSPFAYSDYNHFRTRPFAGKFVHVTDVGYRESTNQGPWPPDPGNVNVFAMGGSTTYGSGVPDDQTVPSFLQSALAEHTKKRICIYNFGVGFYYSTQERLCLEKLLLDGHVPDIAIFIDGINDGYHWDNRPTYSDGMAQLFDQFLTNRSMVSEASYWRSLADTCFYRLPIGRAATALGGRIAPVANEGRANLNWEGQRSVRRVCETYLTNKVLIEQLCLRFGVTPVFVWQPSPAYKYDLTYHLFAPSASEPSQARLKFSIMTECYPKMREQYAQRAEKNFLWCADIQEGRRECLYCDRFHYTGAFAKIFADYICQLCQERKLLVNLL